MLGNRQIHAAIFDLDGVIVDTAKYHYLAWKRLANELGFDFFEEDNERLKGVSRMRSLDILLEVGRLTGKFNETQLHEMAARKNVWYVEAISKMKDDEILPGAIVCLEKFRSLGVKTALGSASSNADLILRGLDLLPLFDAIVDGTVAKKAKPDPDVFLQGAALLGVNAQNCVVFEDAQAGIEAAKSAGMLAVAVGKPETLYGYDMIVAGLHEIKPKDFV